MNISKNNFVTIQGWMAMPKEEGGLALAGAELIAYALLYGFSQDDKSWYQGTQEYLADWCGCTTRNIRNILKSLLDKGYIEKREKRVRNITMYDYRTTDVSNFHPEEKFSGVQEKSSPHNYKNNYTTPSDISSNEDISSPPKGEVEQIVDYLNAKTGKHFLATAKATQRKINARLKEGRTVEDFMKVIDIKVKAWKGDPKWDKFLRPETLFSAEHFDSYLNEEPIVVRKVKRLGERD